MQINRISLVSAYKVTLNIHLEFVSSLQMVPGPQSACKENGNYHSIAYLTYMELKTFYNRTENERDER